MDKINHIADALFTRLGMSNPETVTIPDVVLALGLPQLFDFMAFSLRVVGPEKTVDTLRAVADAIELVEQEAKR